MLFLGNFSVANWLYYHSAGGRSKKFAGIGAKNQILLNEMNRCQFVTPIHLAQKMQDIKLII